MPVFFQNVDSIEIEPLSLTLKEQVGHAEPRRLQRIAHEGGMVGRSFIYGLISNMDPALLAWTSGK